MAIITKSAYELTKDGLETQVYKMENATGAYVTLLNYGGTLTSIVVPDKDGNETDVLLGYEHLSGYEIATTYFGALIGRCGNRIGKGHFTLNGQEYQLALNNGENHLHGGTCGYDSKIWDVEEIDGTLKLSLFSPDGDENYPGNLTISVTYSFTDDNTLGIHYEAVSDADTVVNLTNHAYFNLDGHASGSIEDHMLKLNASHYIPTDSGSIPTGEIAPVAGTAFDFTAFRRIGDGIDDANDIQIQYAGGYDHNWVLDDDTNQLTEASIAYSLVSGIELTTCTTLPGVQFYAGNYIGEDDPSGKNGLTYHKRQGFCLETQVHPDAINNENFPSAVLKAGDKYDTTTTYQFSIHK